MMAAAPELEPMSLEQTAALPLGGRVKVDPWSARIELMKNNRVALLSAREKLPFQVTPLMPHLTRLDSSETQRAAPPAPSDHRRGRRSDDDDRDRDGCYERRRIPTLTDGDSDAAPRG